jgi:DNA polymerase III delta prime subunit
VIGQDHAMEMIAKRIQTSRAGLDNPNKPIGVFMLAGTSGVGKTETALALAEALYGGEQNLITINMSEYQEAHTVSTLKGAPPGYVGYGEGGVLTEAVRRKPYSVVLLDEVEKAHPDVHEIFFQVFDKGWMEDGEGRFIDFKNTLILLTTNAGTELIMAVQGPGTDARPRGHGQGAARAAAEGLPAGAAGPAGGDSVLPAVRRDAGRIVQAAARAASRSACRSATRSRSPTTTSRQADRLALHRKRVGRPHDRRHPDQHHAAGHQPRVPQLVSLTLHQHHIDRHEQLERELSGYVRRFEFEGHQGRYYRYRVEIVPWMWFLTRRADCRIFQDQSVPDIVQSVLAEHVDGASVELKLVRSYRKRTYCVQYRETDFNFIARLLEDEGIYWYFEHQGGRHKLVLVDDLGSHEPAAGLRGAALLRQPRAGAPRRRVPHRVELLARGARQQGRADQLRLREAPGRSLKVGMTARAATPWPTTSCSTSRATMPRAPTASSCWTTASTRSRPALSSSPATATPAAWPRATCSS